MGNGKCIAITNKKPIQAGSKDKYKVVDVGKLVTIQSTKGDAKLYTPVDETMLELFTKIYRESGGESETFNPADFDLVSRRRLTSLERIIRGAQQFEELKRSQGLI